MNQGNENIQPGDVVRVGRHTKRAILYPEVTWVVDEESGWVVTGKSTLGEHEHDPGWIRGSDCFILEKPPVSDAGWQNNRMEFIHREYLTVENKGTGKFVRGVDLPFNKSQLRDAALAEFKQRAIQAILDRGTHEGWSNPATWHVHIQLTNCKDFMLRQLQSLRRKDGTINPSRLIKAWRDLKRMKKVEPVEEWMYALPLDIPAEFEKSNFKDARDTLLRVDWLEITAEFNRVIP